MMHQSRTQGFIFGLTSILVLFGLTLKCFVLEPAFETSATPYRAGFQMNQNSAGQNQHAVECAWEDGLAPVEWLNVLLDRVSDWHLTQIHKSY
jgi:hypothetical protein